MGPPPERPGTFRRSRSVPEQKSPLDQRPEGSSGSPVGGSYEAHGSRRPSRDRRIVPREPSGDLESATPSRSRWIQAAEALDLGSRSPPYKGVGGIPNIRVRSRKASPQGAAGR